MKITIVLLLAIAFQANCQYCKKGDSLQNANNFESAVYYYTLSINAHEDCPDVYYHRGTTKFSLEDYRGAIDDLTIYLNSVTGKESFGFTGLNVRVALMARGVAYSSVGKTDEACKDLGRAGELGAGETAYKLMKEICNK